MGVEVGFSKGDFNIAAGTEVEIGKIKSSSEDLKAETTEIKTYAKLGTSEKSAKFSVGKDMAELEMESGETKIKGEEKKNKVDVSWSYSEKERISEKIK